MDANFIVTTDEELRQAYKEYQEGQFGGWPWDRKDPVYAWEKIKFAKYPDGEVEKKPPMVYAGVALAFI